MYLDVVSTVEVKEQIETNGNGLYKKSEVFDKWKDWHPSVISHHGKMCCEIAREWITTTDFSELGGGSVFTGQRWLQQKFKWGCSVFPIFWCEAVRRKNLDCGALAAMTHEIYNARGVKNYRVQMVQKFSLDATNQWTANWADENALTPWIENDLIYHEGGAIILDNNEIKIWDSSAGWWIEPQQNKGYGSLLAVCLSLPFSQSNENFNWGKNIITENCWQIIAQ